MRDIRVIIVDLSSRSAKTRINALKELKDMDKTDINMSEAVDPILSCLVDNNVVVRGNAAYALWKIAEKGAVDMSRAVEPLIRKLEDGDERVREDSAYALWKIVEKGTVDMSRVVEPLIRRLEDGDKYVRRDTADALRRIAEKGTVDMSRVVEPLIRKLEDGDKYVRRDAAYTLREIAEKGTVDMSRAVEPLIRKLEDGNEHVRRDAADALRRIAEKGTVDMSRAVEPLIRKLEDGDEYVMRDAAYTLSIIAEKGTVDMSRAVETLISKLEDGNEFVRKTAVSALGKIAEKGTVDMSRAVEPLIRRLEDGDKYIRRGSAAYALEKIAAKGTIDVSNAVEPLIKMLISDDKYIYAAAVRALRAISEKSTIDINGEIGGLIYMLQDEEYKQLALFTLGEIVKKESNYGDISLLIGKLSERRSVHAAKFCLNELIKRRKVDVNKLEPILYELMKHKDSCINILGAQILVSIGNHDEQRRGMDCIMDRLTHSQEAAVYAINALKEVGDSYVIKALEAFKMANPKLSRLADECIKEIYQREEMLSRVWRGKYGESKFIPVGGCQPGAIYAKNRTKPGAVGPRKEWIGKVDSINVSTIKEKIASDIYGYFGITIPKTRLAYLEVGNEFTITEGVMSVDKRMFSAEPEIDINVLWSNLIAGGYLEKAGNDYVLTQRFKQLKSDEQMELPQQFNHFKRTIYYMLQQREDIKDAFYRQGKKSATFIMSKLVKNYMYLGEQFIKGILRNEGRPPDKVLVHGREFELRGLMKGLAVAKFLGDTDFLGGGGKNAGFVVKECELGEYAEFIKIDPGDAFNFYALSRRDALEHVKQMEKSKDMFIGNNYPHYIIFNKLSTQQRDELIGTMEKIVEISDKKIERIVRRAGELGKTGGGLHKDEEDRIIEELKGRRDLMKRLYGADIARCKYSKIRNISRSSEQMVLA